jgi:uracil-DNA glycosylase
LSTLSAARGVPQTLAGERAGLVQCAGPLFRSARCAAADRRARAGPARRQTLGRYHFARGHYGAHPDDGLKLADGRITNAVRCVPPENKPTATEIATCREFLKETIAEMKKLRAILALGRIAHDSVLTALGSKKSAAPFKHGGKHRLGDLMLFSSYHCSRYNTNTGVLTPAMFREVFAAVRAYLDGA